MPLPGTITFSVFTAFEHRLQTVQPEISLLLFFAVTSGTRRLKQGLDLLGVREALLGGGRGKFAEIRPGPSGQGKQGGSGKNEQG